MNKCCLKNLPKAKHISKCKWVCPDCNKDISIAYIHYYMAVNETVIKKDAPESEVE